MNGDYMTDADNKTVIFDGRVGGDDILRVFNEPPILKGGGQRQRLDQNLHSTERMNLFYFPTRRAVDYSSKRKTHYNSPAHNNKSRLYSMCK